MSRNVAKLKDKELITRIYKKFLETFSEKIQREKNGQMM